MKRILMGVITIVLFLPLQVATAADSRDVLVDTQISQRIQAHAQADKSLLDGVAFVYKVTGNAVLVKSGSPVEAAVKVGDKIVAGDSIRTEKKSTVSIAFDFLNKNAVQIPAESKAVFKSIEPTDIQLEDGKVFSVVDGLPEGSTWKVTTPSAVAAVRGTIYLVSYEAETKQFYAATLDMPDDGKTSAIEIQPVNADAKGSASVPEGKEIALQGGQVPNSDMVKNLNPETMASVQQFFQEVTLQRQEASAEIEGGKKTDDNKGNGGPSNPGDPSGPGNGGSSNGTSSSANNANSSAMDLAVKAAATGALGSMSQTQDAANKMDASSSRGADAESGFGESAPDTRQGSAVDQSGFDSTAKNQDYTARDSFQENNNNTSAATGFAGDAAEGGDSFGGSTYTNQSGPNYDFTQSPVAQTDSLKSGTSADCQTTTSGYRTNGC